MVLKCLYLRVLGYLQLRYLQLRVSAVCCITQMLTVAHVHTAIRTGRRLLDALRMLGVWIFNLSWECVRFSEWR